MKENMWKLQCFNVCKAGNEAVADDGDIVLFFGGPGTPLTSTAPSGKGTERHSADVVTTVAPDGTRGSHARNHDFITFRTGMQCAPCKQVVCILCDTCRSCVPCLLFCRSTSLRRGGAECCGRCL